MGKKREDEMQSIITRLFVLGFIGLLASIWLVYDHWNPGTHALCEISAVVSCSVVNKSIYSEIFNVPVAVFGVLWHLAFLFMLAKARTAGFYWVTAIFVWCIAAIGFVFYLLYAEWVLRTICPYCTVVHVVCIACMWYAWRLYTSQSIHASFFVVIYELRKWVLFWAIAFMIPLVLFNLRAGESSHSREYLDRCLYEKKAVMYGAPTCSFCQEQKRVLRDSFEMVTFVDCNADKKACEAHSIEHFPTWVLEDNGVEVKRHAGVLSIEKLIEFYQCVAPTTAPVAG